MTPSDSASEERKDALLVQIAHNADAEVARYKREAELQKERADHMETLNRENVAHYRAALSDAREALEDIKAVNDNLWAENGELAQQVSDAREALERVGELAGKWEDIHSAAYAAAAAELRDALSTPQRKDPDGPTA